MTTYKYRCAKIIQARIALVTGIEAAPTNPPEKLSGQWPFSVAIINRGVVSGGTNVGTTDIYDLTVQIHYSRKGLPHSYEQAMLYDESVIDAVLADLNLTDATGLAGQIVNPDGIPWAFGESQYAGVQTLAFEFNITIKNHR